MGLLPQSWSYRDGKGSHIGFLPDAQGKSERNWRYFKKIKWRDGEQTGNVEERRDVLRSSLLTLLESQTFGDERFHHLFYVIGGRGFVEGITPTNEPVRISRLRKTVVVAPAGKPLEWSWRSINKSANSRNQAINAATIESLQALLASERS